MPQLIPYLTFGGNCRDAMTFYKQALGGDLVVQTVGESPMAKQMPPEAHKNVMHSTLTNGAMNLYASDQMGAEAVNQGNTVTLLINCTSEAEINALFSKLSVGGKVTHPLKEEFWGSVYGDFQDRFGVRWMMNWDKPKK